MINFIFKKWFQLTDEEFEQVKKNSMNTVRESGDIGKTEARIIQYGKYVIAAFLMLCAVKIIELLTIIAAK